MRVEKLAPSKPPPVHPPSELLTIEEVAKRLRVEPYTVRRYIANKRLPAVKLGRSHRLNWLSVLEWVDSGGAAAPAHVPHRGNFTRQHQPARRAA